ncbi:MAG TPA: hypothetical protein V6D20_02940 [Candidatus Obscuribacterales bacterium]
MTVIRALYLVCNLDRALDLNCALIPEVQHKLQEVQDRLPKAANAAGEKLKLWRNCSTQ